LLPAIRSLPRIVPGDDPRSQQADDAGRGANSDSLGGRSLIHRAGTDYGVPPDADTGTDDHAAAQLDAVANHDGPAASQLGLAQRAASAG
jgi:hypothetical protein